MAIVAGQTATAADVSAIKDDVDAIISADADTVATLETTTSTSFTDLTTAGPAVTLTTGTTALVIVYAVLFNNTAGEQALMDYAVSGASTRAAAVETALAIQSSGSNDRMRASAAMLLTGLTAGSNTFTAKYRVTANTGNFQDRKITVIPLGD